MTNNKNVWIDAVAKMIQLTQEGKLKWEPQSASTSVRQAPDDKVESVLISNYKGKKLRLYRRFFKNFRHVGGLANLLGNMESFWDEDIVLEFIATDGSPLWRFPEMNVLDDLMSAAQYQAAGVKDFLDDILTED